MLGQVTDSRGHRSVRYRDLFRDAEFTGLYVADALNVTGSYLTRLAVAAFVYRDTGSVGLTGAVFAASYAPYLLSPFMATLADRFPRKGLMVLSDVLRCALVLLLLLPSTPFAGLLAVLFTLELIRIPFGAARLATLADVLDEERFPVGNALVGATRQVLQVGGFLIGGFLVAATSPQTAIVIDAVTFVCSAVLILVFVERRPVAWDTDQAPPAMWAATREGFAIIGRTPHMMPWFGLLALGPGLIVIAEGLAVPYADQLGGDVRLAGVIMATAPVGTAIGFAIFGRLSVDQQNRLVYPCAYAAGLLVALAGALGALGGSPIPLLLVLTLSGATLSYLVAIQAQVAAVIPRSARGRVFGLGNSVMQLAQGGAILAAGVVAVSLPIGEVLVVLGLLGVGIVAVIGWRDRTEPVRHSEAARGD